MTAVSALTAPLQGGKRDACYPCWMWKSFDISPTNSFLHLLLFVGYGLRVWGLIVASCCSSVFEKTPN